MYSLYVAYVYTSYLKDKYKCHVSLIWRNGVIEFPSSELKQKWDKVIEVDIKAHLNKDLIRKNNSIRKEVDFVVRGSGVISDIDYLFVFKDNYIVDSLLLDMVRYNKKVKKVLIEEGVGIYNKSEYSGALEGSYIKKAALIVLYRLCKVPVYALKGQGFSGMLEVMIVKDPEKLMFCKKDITIYKQSDVFTRKYVKSFIDIIVGNNSVPDKHVDFIYIGQPLSEDRIVTIVDESDMLDKIIASIGDKGNIFIKTHPRENKSKYLKVLYENENAYILDDSYLALPAELICSLLGYPKLITVFSSVAFNMVKYGSYDQVYLLYEMIPLPRDQKDHLDKIFADDSFVKITQQNLLFPQLWDDSKGSLVVRQNIQIKNQYCEIDEIISMIK